MTLEATICPCASMPVNNFVPERSTLADPLSIASVSPKLSDFAVKFRPYELKLTLFSIVAADL